MRAPTPTPPKRVLSPVSFADVPTHTEIKNDNNKFNYMSDTEEDNQPHCTIRWSKQVIHQLRNIEKDNLHRITALAENETATVHNLIVRNNKLADGMTSATLSYQLDMWGYKGATKSMRAVNNKTTGKVCF